MLLQETCRQCNVTKKALDYYESKGLLSPAVLENGYRDYRTNDIIRIKEIVVLRQFGLSISDIKGSLDDTNKCLMLEKIKYVSRLQAERLATMQNSINQLIQNYDIETVFEQVQFALINHYSIKERMALAFPGSYGMLISLHFGQFLNEVIETDTQRNAYQSIMNYLDNISLFISPELHEFLKSLFSDIEKMDTERLAQDMQKEMTAVFENTEDYLISNQNDIEEYIKFRQSYAFKTSLAGQMQKKLLEFQQQSGYQEQFLDNLKILSPSYYQYSLQLEQANKVFVQKFSDSNTW